MKKSVAEEGISKCKNCGEQPCIKATAADWRSMIHTAVHYGDEITWAILPYVSWQYEERARDCSGVLNLHHKYRRERYI